MTANIVDATKSIMNNILESQAMKRFVAVSVIGAFLMSAPVAFALDKTSADTMKEPVKSETAPVAKKTEPAKDIVAKTEGVKTAAKTDAKAPAVGDAKVTSVDGKAAHASGKNAPALDGKAAPLVEKSASKPAVHTGKAAPADGADLKTATPKAAKAENGKLPVAAKSTDGAPKAN